MGQASVAKSALMMCPDGQQPTGLATARTQLPPNFQGHWEGVLFQGPFPCPAENSSLSRPKCKCLGVKSRTSERTVEISGQGHSQRWDLLFSPGRKAAYHRDYCLPSPTGHIKTRLKKGLFQLVTERGVQSSHLFPL